MAGEEIIDASANTIGQLAVQIGSIGRWLQALGIVVILWIIINIINWRLNKKRLKTLYAMEKTLARIEKKVDKVVKK